MKEKLSDLSEISTASAYERRMHVLRMVTDLYLQMPYTATDSEQQNHDKLLTHLATDAGPVMRREIAERLSSLEEPPQKLLMMLAVDAIDVARPVLEHSMSLDDDALEHIANTTTAEHRICIAKRPSLSNRMIQVLAAKREADVMLTLANHPDVKKERARQKQAMAKKKIAPNLKLKTKQQNYKIVPTTIKLASPQAQDPAPVAKEKSPKKLINPLNSPFWNGDTNQRMLILRAASKQTIFNKIPKSVSAPMMTADKKDRSAALSGLARLVVNKHMIEFRDMFAKLIDVPFELMENIIADPYGEPFLIACRAAGFPQDAFTTLLLLYNRSVSYSSERVFALSEIYEKVSPSLCWNFIESWKLPAMVTLKEEMLEAEIEEQSAPTEEIAEKPVQHAPAVGKLSRIQVLRPRQVAVKRGQVVRPQVATAGDRK